MGKKKAPRGHCWKCDSADVLIFPGDADEICYFCHGSMEPSFQDSSVVKIILSQQMNILLKLLKGETP